MPEPIESPPFRDSDAIQIIIRRLELIAEKMLRRDYDAEFERHMTEAAEWLDWLAAAINARNDEEGDSDA